MESPKRDCNLGTCVVKRWRSKRHCHYFLQFRGFPQGQGLRSGRLRSRNAAFCVSIVQPTKSPQHHHHPQSCATQPNQGRGRGGGRVGRGRGICQKLLLVSLLGLLGGRPANVTFQSLWSDFEFFGGWGTFWICEIPLLSALCTCLPLQRKREEDEEEREKLKTNKSASSQPLQELLRLAGSGLPQGPFQRTIFTPLKVG